MQPATLKALDAVISGLETVTGAIRQDTEKVLLTNDPIEVVKHFDALRKSQERVKVARKALEEMADDLSIVKIPLLFGNKSVKTMNIEGVGRVTVAYRWNASIIDDPKKGKKIGMDWLRKNGAASLITETVNAQTLAAYAKELFESKEQDLPAELFKVGQAPYTSITKA